MRVFSFSRFSSAQRGMTFIELIVVFGIAAILLAVAVPNMGVGINAARSRTAADAFAHAAALARGRALQNGQPATLYVNSVAPGCGASAVAWAVVQSAAAVSCVSATDFSARFHGATMQSNFTQVIYAPTGLASNTFDGTAQFSSVNAAGAPATVTVYAGGSVAVVGD